MTRINLGAGNNVYTASGITSKRVYGQGGNDTITTDGGNDLLDGGTGNDILSGGAGANTLYGGGGEDLLITGSGADWIDGGAGFDTLQTDLTGTSAPIFLNVFDLAVPAYLGGTTVLNVELFDLTLGSGADIVYLDHSVVANDTIEGRGGSDIIRTGYGDDTIYGGNGEDVLSGGEGIDEIYGEANNDTISGDGGADELFGGSGDDSIFGGLGNDLIDGGSGIDTLRGEAGDDTIYGTANNDVLFGGGGNDYLIGGGGDNTLNGGSGNDVIDTASGADTIDAGGGDDSILTQFLRAVNVQDAADTIDGGDGYDVLTINRGPGSNLAGPGFILQVADTAIATVIGGFGSSIVNVEEFDLYLFDGADTIALAGGDDFVDGGGGADTIDLGGGFDTFQFNDRTSIADTEFVMTDTAIATEFRGNGTTVVNVEQFVVLTGAGADRIVLLDGDDEIRTSDGADTIEAGGGNDLVDGGAGADVLSGGSGNDIFFFEAADFSTGQFDNISDFSSLAGSNFDVLRLEGAANNYAFVQSANGVLMTQLATGGGVIIQNTSVAVLQSQIEYF